MTPITEHANVTSSNPTIEELKQQIKDLEKQAQGRTTAGELAFKVSDKGAVSVYGLQRFPVTLYFEQWEKLLDGRVAGALLDFIEQGKESGQLIPKPAPAPRVGATTPDTRKTGVTMDRAEVGLLPGMIAKYTSQNQPDVAAVLMTLQSTNQLNGKVPYDLYVKFRELTGK